MVFRRRKGTGLSKWQPTVRSEITENSGSTYGNILTIGKFPERILNFAMIQKEIPSNQSKTNASHEKLPGFQSLKYLLLAIQTAICTLFSSGNCQTKQETDSIMEFIQNNFYSQGEKSKESLATLYRISREQGDYDLLAEAIYPKSVIRLWGDCPLVSCSMLLA